MTTGKFVRPGLTDSDAVCPLSDWAFRIYILSLIESDHAGRLDGRPEILRSRLFPLGTSRRVEDFSKAIEELKGHKLVIAYEFDGKPYLQLTKIEKTGNAAVSQFPWTDGVFKIDYIEVNVRDPQQGNRKKCFVSSSLFNPIQTPSIPHPDPIPTPLVLSSKSGSKSLSEKEVEKTGLSIPASLDTPEFNEAWEDYIGYRISRKLSKLQPISIKKHFKEFEEWGCAKAIEAINTTIRQGWQGVFNPDNKGKSSASPNRKSANGEYPAERRPLPAFGSKPR